ncbi:MAG: hypothetical protein QM706_08980 [Nitrospira sp.]
MLDLNGYPSPNLSLIAIGILGMAFGFNPIHKVTNWSRHLPMVIGLNVACNLAISIWQENYVLQVISVGLAVMLIYLVGEKGMGCDQFRDMMVLLGKYSLFSYIAQIGLLQLLRRGLLPLNFSAWILLTISFIAAFALTIATVSLTHHVRRKSSIADWFYAVAFS